MSSVFLPPKALPLDPLPLNSLLPELWRYIFSFLPIHRTLPIQLVCKQWHRLYLQTLPRIRTIHSSEWHDSMDLMKVPNLESFYGKMQINEFPIMKLLQTLIVTASWRNLVGRTIGGKISLFEDIFIQALYRIIGGCNNLRVLKINCSYKNKSFFFHYVQGDYIETNLDFFSGEDDNLSGVIPSLKYGKVILRDVYLWRYGNVYPDYLNNVELIIYLTDNVGRKPASITTDHFLGKYTKAFVYLPKDCYEITDNISNDVLNFDQSYTTIDNYDDQRVELTFIKL